MAIKTIPLSRLEADLTKTLNECAETGETVVVERPDAEPNPAVEVRQSLPNGTEVKTVWSFLAQSGVAKLVTVHFFDGS
jgi:hypothetical protein